MATPRKRRELSLAQKVELLQSLSTPGATPTIIAKVFGVSTSQVYRLVNDKDAIFALYENGLSDRKHNMRRRKCKEQVVSEALHVWYRERTAQGEHLSGPILKAKATELAAARGRDFIPSAGWLSRWKLRYNITFKNGQCEKQQMEPDHSQACDVNEDSRVIEVLSKYSPSDLFTAFETPLCFRGYPAENGICRKGSEFPGGIRANERITVMLCSNITGAEKRPILAIGKSNLPKSILTDSDVHLPVSYTSATNSWMTRDIFLEWLLGWNLELRDGNRHICLLVYDCPVHNLQDIKLSNIMLVLLPLHKTSILCPMEVGVTKIWKAHYRSKLCSRVTAALDADVDKLALDVAGSLTLLDALYLVKDAWDAVMSQNIFDCYAKAGFLKRECDDENRDDDDVFTNILIPENMTMQEFGEFISVDDDLEVEGELSDLDLLSVASKHLDRLAGKKGVSEDADFEGLLTNKQKITMLDHLRRFVQENAMEDLIPFVRKIENKVYSQVSGT